MTLKILNMALMEDSPVLENARPQINVSYGQQTVPMEQSTVAAAKPGL